MKGGEDIYFSNVIKWTLYYYFNDWLKILFIPYECFLAYYRVFHLWSSWDRTVPFHLTVLENDPKLFTTLCNVNRSTIQSTYESNIRLWLFILWKKRDLCLQRFWGVLWLVLSRRSNNWAQWSRWCYTPWISNELHWAQQSQVPFHWPQWSKPTWTGGKFSPISPLSLQSPERAT